MGEPSPIGCCVLGASVSLWDKDGALLKTAAEELVSKAGLAADRVDTCAVNVSDPVAVQSAADCTAEAFGKIDILVANAGISGPNAKCWEYPVDAWQQVMEINLNGVFYCCRAIVPYMLRAGYGRIVNVASIAGKEGNPNASAYSASKAGVIALTKSLGKELAQLNIAVNCITPSAARTRILSR